MLIDVSGSMHGLEGWEVSLALSILRSSRGGSHVYAISSEYREITDYLRLRSMQGELSAVISSMDTGTAIGPPALAGLVREHPEHAEGRHAVVVSDGLDLGDPAKMAEGVRALRMLSRSILWIDPLLDNPGSSVRTDGLLASLPFIDSLVSRRDLLTRPFHEAFRNGVLRVTSYRV
ncbi:VWA domain-containing protein [Thermogymnomonas acidicola]|uniref:VWA domain-containing protein n=1 Tax=Thermogymnomonas acidicola TaxID=399579 RepID=UPI000946791A|nr:VWA domain-containing protein [Thermogymnomonas acidicola]